MNKQLVDFYTRGGKDHQGRRISDILVFSNPELEETHDYIQWLFPTRTASQFNPDAPILDDETIAALKASHFFHRNFALAVQRIMSFWGVSRHWQQKNDHNLLRMTRFIEACVLLGYRDKGLDLYEGLVYLSQRPHGNFITKENLKFWKNAIEAK